jgi:DNA-binding XRE family transcriptional regulator
MPISAADLTELAMNVKNERQYRLARTRLAASERGLEEVQATGASLSEPIGSAYVAGYVGNINELRADIAEYEAIRDGHTVIEIKELSDLPLAMIKKRIQLGLTQRDLAERIGAHEQQVQRWEENEYQGVQFDTIERVAGALEIALFAAP